MRVVLFQPDIAGNLGAAMRACACFDTPLEIIEPCGFPLTAKALRRTAMDYGATENLTRHTSWEHFVENISAARNPRLILMTTRGATSLTDHAFEKNDILLFGRESAGVPDYVHTFADCAVKIPISGSARSLNLATSVAIGVFEANRQLGRLV